MEESPGRAPSLTAHLARGRHNLNVLHGSEERFNAVDATQGGSGKTPESSPEHPLERKSNRSELWRQAESASPGRVSHMVQGAEVINVPIDWTKPSEMRKTAARVVVPETRVAELTRQAESASPERVSHMVLGAEVLNVPMDWTNPSEVRKTAARVVVPAARVAELTNDENPLRLSRKMATRVADGPLGAEMDYKSCLAMYHRSVAREQELQIIEGHMPKQRSYACRTEGRKFPTPTSAILRFSQDLEATEVSQEATVNARPMFTSDVTLQQSSDQTITSDVALESSDL